MLLKAETTNNLVAILEPLSLGELRDVYRVMRAMWNYKSELVTRSFSVGQKVEWVGRGQLRYGTVVGFNRKTVKVKANEEDGGQIWRVSPAFLKERQ